MHLETERDSHWVLLPNRTNLDTAKCVSHRCVMATVTLSCLFLLLVRSIVGVLSDWRTADANLFNGIPRPVHQHVCREVPQGVPQGGPCDLDTGGTCRIFGCDKSRAAHCVDGKCVCRGGLCAQDGVCQRHSTCNHDTGGTCEFLSCRQSRGPVNCVAGRCVCSSGFCSVHGHCIRTYDIIASVVPVNKDNPIFPGNHGNITTALAISGGGTRSLSLTLGALRALEGLDLMRHVDAVSAVSGGSWASSIYMFANRTTSELLGGLSDFAHLDMSSLSEDPPLLGQPGTTPVSPRLEARMLDPSQMSQKVWQDTIASVMLGPFNLDSSTGYFVPNTETRDRIIQENPRLAQADFIVQRPDRPKVFIMNGALLTPPGYTPSKDNIVSFQMSPDFIGSPYHPDYGPVRYASLMSSIDRIVGGGFVDSVAFGGDAPQTGEGGGSCVRMEAQKTMFTLGDAIGVSSGAYAVTAHRTTSVADLIPTVKYWPVSEQAQSAEVYQVGDGGAIDCAGLLALLQRGAKRVVWLINTDVGLTTFVDFCSTPELDSYEGMVTNQMTDKFGYGSDSSKGHYSRNQVFSKGDFLPVLCDLQSRKREGRATVVQSTHRVLANSWWGIEGGFDVSIAYVYNEKSARFLEELPEDVQDAIGHDPEFSKFPFFSTMYQTSDCTAYTNSEINLLAASSEYAMLQNVEIIREVLGVSNQSDLEPNTRF